MTFDLSKPCQYRNGTPARVLCTDKPGLLTVVSMDETGRIWLHAANGHCAGDRRDLDLINVPEKRERIDQTVFVNVWRVNKTYHTTQRQAEEEVRDVDPIRTAVRCRLVEIVEDEV